MLAFRQHEAIREVLVEPEEFMLLVRTEDTKLMDSIRRMTVKMQKTLDDCRSAVNGRTPFMITQERIAIRELS